MHLSFVEYENIVELVAYALIEDDNDRWRKYSNPVGCDHLWKIFVTDILAKLNKTHPMFIPLDKYMTSEWIKCMNSGKDVEYKRLAYF